MIFFPNLLIMVDYYVTHFSGVVGGVLCYIGAQVRYSLSGRWERSARAGDGVVLVVFGGYIVMVGV